MNHRRFSTVMMLFLFLIIAFVTDNLRQAASGMVGRAQEALLEECRLRAEMLALKLASGLEATGDERSFFAGLEYTPAQPASVEIASGPDGPLVLVRQPIDGNRGLLAVKPLTSALLSALKNLQVIAVFLLILALVMSTVALFYLVFLFRKRPEREPAEELGPLNTYLAELQNSAQDLSERVATQSRLAVINEELNRSIVASMPLPLLLLNQAGRIEIFNPAAEKVFGVSHAGARNNLPAVVFKSFPEIAALLDRYERVSGREIESAGRIFNADLLPVASGTLAVIRDVSEEKRREALSQLHTNYSLLGEVAASFTHEIKNGLAAIYGFSSTVCPEEDFRARIKREVEYLNAVIASFLNFARPLADQNRRECRIDEIIAAAAKENSLELKLTGRDFILPDSDPVLLSVIFGNLAANARQAGASSIFVESDQAGQSLRLTFRDDGPGISDSLREKIWQPFFSGREGGSGLGLANVRKTVQFLGGEIELDQAETGGASFLLLLPLPG